jgi:hypothetical protein
MSIKGNSGFVNIDKRFGTATGDTKGMVQREQHFLERKQNRMPSGGPAGVEDYFCSGNGGTGDNGSCLFVDDFRSGGFTSPQVGDPWTVVNGSEASTWIVGTDIRDDNAGSGNEGGSSVTIASGKTNCAFISSNGTNNYYTTNSEPHIYFTFDIPSDAVSLTLEFDWMCYGEISSSDTAYTNYDFGYLLFFDQAGFTPAAGTKYDDGTSPSETDWERIIGSNTADFNSGGRFSGDGGSGNARSENTSRTQFVYENITIDGTEIGETGLWCTNCTRSISFSWMSDGSIQDNPSMTIANVRLSYNV